MTEEENKQQPDDFKGFPKPEKNWFATPYAFIDELPNIKTLAELKVLIYLMRHSWGFQEFDIKKRLTTDEFMRGRKKTDGSRMDDGTGFSKPTVISGLKAAVKHGYIFEKRDERDKARVKKYYTLKMEPELESEDGEEGKPAETPQNEENLGVKNVDTGVKGSDESNVKDLNTGAKDVDIEGKELLHRTEKQTSESAINVNVNEDNKKTKTTATSSREETNSLKRLPKQSVDTRDVAAIVNDVIVVTGDSHSKNNYRLIAWRIPRNVIYEALSELKLGGADNRGAVFTAMMYNWAEAYLAEQQKQKFTQARSQTKIGHI